MKGKIFYLGLGAALVVAACDRTPQEEAEAVRPVRSIVAEAPARQRVQAFPGLAEAVQELNLSFRISGRLVERPVDVGQELSEGDVIARLDPTDFELAVTNVEGRLERSRAQLERAQADLAREESIQREDPGATTQKALDRARQLVASNESEVKSLEAELRVAMNQLSYATLTSPFEGRVVATFVENFEDVRQTQEIVRLLDTTQIEMTIFVPEAAMQAIDRVTDITVAFDQVPGHHIKADIKEIGTEASAVTRTYPITLIMDPPDDTLILAGMAGYAAVTFALAEEEVLEGIEVPTTAIAIDRRGRKFVWVVEPNLGEVMMRFVELGRVTDDGVMITDGIEEGDEVVTAGVSFLSRGQKVDAMR